MRILLIHPQNYLHRRSTGIYGRSLRYAPLTMPTLKALVPSDLEAEVQIVDEMVENVDLSLRPDLVGITAITGTAPRAYYIADAFRSQGVPVVLGGVHPTLMPDEAARHADAVVLGYAERTWPSLLRDFSNGRLQRIYQDSEPLDPALIVPPDRSGIRRKDYLGWCTVEMSRGCPNSCEFCISHRFHHQYVCRPVNRVIEEVRSLKSKVVFFLDPNLIGDRDHAKDFFREFAKLNRWWVGCATLDVVEDETLLNVLVRSGCKGLLMGFESTNPEALESSSKFRNRGKDYRQVLRVLHEHGILVQACFVFGFDADDRSVFERTARYIVDTGFDLPQISIFTPFPGTPIFEKLQREGRILTWDWSCYNGQRAVFQPLQMSAGELERGTDWVRRQCFRWSALARRLMTPPLHLKPFVALSYASFRRYQRSIDALGRTVEQKEGSETLREDLLLSEGRSPRTHCSNGCEERGAKA